mmetsp:Transcript_32656/g.75012  ORF Transcript_32656/g.75012 Transcript_32656/m.75012 type:complete len:213 (-) Transcript_32656:253-891(-)
MQHSCKLCMLDLDIATDNRWLRVHSRLVPMSLRIRLPIARCDVLQSQRMVIRVRADANDGNAQLRGSEGGRDLVHVRPTNQRKLVLLHGRLLDVANERNDVLLRNLPQTPGTGRYSVSIPQGKNKHQSHLEQAVYQGRCVRVGEPHKPGQSFQPGDDPHIAGGDNVGQVGGSSEEHGSEHFRCRLRVLSTVTSPNSRVGQQVNVAVLCPLRP